MMYVTVQVTPFAQNCSLVWCSETMKGAAVDPGGDLDRITRTAEAKGVTIEKILLTHGHIDHAGEAGILAKSLGVPIEGPHRDDKPWLDQMTDQARMFGVTFGKRFTPDRWLEDGDTVTFGTIVLSVLHCPGHSAGHVVFFEPSSRVALVGDVLFQGSIGRTDFPGGDHATLIRSIRERLLPLGDDVTFISGHGPNSTFGTERRSNPYL
ncbi:MAG: MBL fold metallo-hydrolase [Alphaproteobacteria bacterium]